MKMLTTALFVAALATASSLALAQPGHDHDDHGHHDHHEWHDRDHGHDRHDYRQGPPRYVSHHGRWERGHHYHGPTYVVRDYYSYRLRPPPRGYHWVRADDGEYLLVAIATGIILDIALH